MDQSDSESLASTLVITDDDSEPESTLSGVSAAASDVTVEPPPPTPRLKAIRHQQQMIETYSTIQQRQAYRDGVFNNWDRLQSESKQKKIYHIFNQVGLNREEQIQVEVKDETVEDLWVILMNVKEEISELWRDFHFHGDQARYWANQDRETRQ